MRSIALLLTALALLLTGTGAASAATYTVNSTANAPDAVTDGVCDSDAGAPVVCTLRAAIDESNASTIVDDTIGVDSSVAGQTTTAVTALAVSDTVTIDGCTSNPTSTVPCFGVRGNTTFVNGLTFNAATTGTVIKRLAITNALNGVFVSSGLQNVSLRGNWLGIKLDGTAEGNTTGVDFTSTGVQTLGGTVAGDRNVLGNNTTGVRVSGDNVTIQANYFGTKADGTTAAPNGTNVVVTGASVPSNVLIGGDPVGGSDTTAACDGPCNLIAYATSHGIDLSPLPNADDVDIRGNYIGVNLSSTGAAGNLRGINVGNADGVTIGGAGAGAANYIAGNENGGITATAANNLLIEGNRIGLDFEQDALPNGSVNVSVQSGATGAVVRSNVIGGDGTAPFNGVAIGASGVTVEGNAIGYRTTDGALRGFPGDAVRVDGDNNDIGTAVGPVNTIGGAGAHGIHVVGASGNDIVRNQIGRDGSDNDIGNTGAGVRITGGLGTTGNQIGGATTALANVIENNDDAIEIDGNGTDTNTIGINTGLGNSGRFIDLTPPAGAGNDPATGSNSGIQSPAVIEGHADRMTGVGAPNATIRLYLRAAASAAGDLGSFAATATADADGLWTVSGSGIFGNNTNEGVAMQTDAAGNSSELSAPAPSEAAGSDITPPSVSITAPPDPGNDATPAIGFTVSDNSGGSPSAICRVDSGPYSACTSPFLSPFLADGSHTVQVKGIDDSGNSSAAESDTFTIDTVAPDTSISAGPTGTISDPTPTFGFAGAGGATAFQCRVDGAAFAGCASPLTVSPLTEGAHTFHVRALDAAGNSDPTPAPRSFVVDLPGPPNPTAPAGPTAAQILAALTSDLRAAARTLTRLRARKLVRRRSATVKGVDALLAGLVRMEGAATVSGKSGVAKRVVIVRGTRRFASAAKGNLKLRLTKAGRRLLRRTRRTRLTLSASFTDAAGNRTRARPRKLTIKRR